MIKKKVFVIGGVKVKFSSYATWSHPKHAGKVFKGKYQKKPNGERNFVLICITKKLKEIDFNSFQAAKDAKWEITRN